MVKSTRLTIRVALAGCGSILGLDFLYGMCLLVFCSAREGRGGGGEGMGSPGNPFFPFLLTNQG